MDDAPVFAAATARYEAFRVLLPKVVDDLEATMHAPGVSLGWETRATLVSAAANATARLVVGSASEPDA